MVEIQDDFIMVSEAQREAYLHGFDVGVKPCSIFNAARPKQSPQITSKMRHSSSTCS